MDCTCINYDGNAFDAALLAMLGALRNSEFNMLDEYRVIDDAR